MIVEYEVTLPKDFADKEKAEQILKVLQKHSSPSNRTVHSYTEKPSNWKEMMGALEWEPQILLNGFVDVSYSKGVERDGSEKAEHKEVVDEVRAIVPLANITSRWAYPPDWDHTFSTEDDDGRGKTAEEE